MSKCNKIASYLLFYTKFIDSVQKLIKILTLQVIESLRQSTRDKIILYINLLIIVTGSIGLYVYFSINPFSQEEILNLQKEVLKNISRSLANQENVSS